MSLTLPPFSRAVAGCLAFFLACAGPAARAATACATPGKDGTVSTSGTPGGVVYMTPTASVAAGATSISVSSTSGLAAGDLVLVIQMQGADINSTNSASYGDGSGIGAGYLSNANLTAGQYEYAAVQSVTGTVITLKGGLANSYVLGAYVAGSNGQRSYQVIRVPQYVNLTLSGNLTGTAWNGATGGVLPLDVAGTLNFNGFSVVMDYTGFRGGGARQLNGANGGSNTDYVTLSTKAFNGSKGEGIAGTPIYTYNQIAATLSTGAVEGYPAGSFARGAPATGGGGATDGDPPANDQNSGGGGGGNGGAGAQGGNSWSSNLAVGGRGGAAFAQTAVSRVVMGGGGGAGSRNNSTGLQSSGGQGGGIVIVRATAIAGPGTISANGGTGPAPANDGGGGGGAGGSIVLLTGSQTGSITLNATGGAGASDCSGCGTGNNHGPGGGGGGGVVYTNSVVSASINTAQGASGTTADGTYYGATTSGGNPGGNVPNSSPNAVAGSGFACLVPVLTVVKSANTASAAPGTVITYTLTVTNTSTAPAYNVMLTDTMPPTWSAIFVPNAYGSGVNFKFTDSTTTPSGLTVGSTQYSTNNGSTYATLPGAAGWQTTMTNWRVNMSGTMAAGGQFTLQYQATVQ